MSFFAIQVKPEETDLRTLERTLKVAKSLGLSFKLIEILDKLELGSSKFLRIKSDLIDPTLLLDALAPERGVVGPREGVYTLRINGKTGLVPNSRMFTVPRTPKAYRGTADPHWERQFSKPN